MKLFNIVCSVSLTALAAFSFNASAATTPISCDWTFVSVNYGSSGAFRTYACYDGSVLAATKTIGYGSVTGQCSVQTFPGYTYGGLWCEPVVLKYI